MKVLICRKKSYQSSPRNQNTSHIIERMITLVWEYKRILYFARIKPFDKNFPIETFIKTQNIIIILNTNIT